VGILAVVPVYLIGLPVALAALVLSWLASGALWVSDRLLDLAEWVAD
jgi:hypothetical protein